MERWIIESSMKITIIIPFFNGNKYLPRLLKSINQVAIRIKDKASLQIIIVNDSPEVEVELPDVSNYFVEVEIKVNDHNVGIQRSRIHGLRVAKGSWILFLDQDDELIADGFEKQINLTSNADVVVGNGFYQYRHGTTQIFNSLKSMNLLIRKKNFIQIRNLIPSPGECLIKKSAIPKSWINSILLTNGADDWLLWLLLFSSKCRFTCNQEYVYIHNNSNGQNLSLNIDKMYKSCIEMRDLLYKMKLFSNKEISSLHRAIDFKYLQDTNQLTLGKLVYYSDVLKNNFIYKLCLRVY